MLTRQRLDAQKSVKVNSKRTANPLNYASNPCILGWI